MAIICWDNLEGFIISKNGNLIRRRPRLKFWYIKTCICCGEECLCGHKSSKFCGSKCASSGEFNGMYGRSNQANLGKKHTEKTKEKMKLTQLGEKNHFFGKKHTKETLKKISGENNHRFGNPVPEGTRKKIAGTLKGKMAGENNPRYGYKYTEAEREEKSIQTSGCNNPMYGRKGKLSPAWRGGVSGEPYCDVWRDKDYKDFIKERDNNECQNPDCWKRCRHLPLNIHHIDYNKKNCQPTNLITLCVSCNVRANTNKDGWQKIYQEIIESYEDS